ncbi:hypothetical protein BG000_004128 [Podila horticola]|nr:hypothetical protein BG000_004128 [Podila horticola]
MANLSSAPRGRCHWLTVGVYRAQDLPGRYYRRAKARCIDCISGAAVRWWFLADSYDIHDIQRRILVQLGALTDLEELNLSQQTYNDAMYEIDFTHGISWSTQMYNCDIQVGCLEMSLAGGLDLLSGLKKLKVLDLSNMSHKDGVSELEWMKANWPRLEQVSGLFDTGFRVLEPGVRSWIEERRPEWGEKHNGSELRDYEDDDLY